MLRVFINLRRVSLPCGLLMIVAMGSALPLQSPKNQDETVKLKTNLITMDVTVKDKRGKYITDLRAEDFTVIENGVPQKIEFFDPPLAGDSASSPPETVDPARPVTAGQRTSHVISLVMDGATTEQSNLQQVRAGLRRYIGQRIKPADVTAVFAITTDLRLLQAFTQDKAKLLAAVDKPIDLTAANRNSERNQFASDIQQMREEMVGLPDTSSMPQTPAAASLGSAAARRIVLTTVLQQYIKLRSQLSAQQARPVLAALAAICEALRGVPGKKTLVLFSEGFITPGTLDWQVQSVIDIANRANVAIYIIDSAGLRTAAPLSTGPGPMSPLAGVSATNSTEERIRASGGENVFDNVRQEGLNRQYDILYRLAGDTGGQFIKGTNDIGKGLERIDLELRARYTLAYHSSDPNFDGQFRKVKIEVRRADAHPISRAGYYANASDSVVSLSADEKQLLGSLATIQAGSTLPLFLELTPFRFKEGHYLVPLALEVPPSLVKFERKGDKQLAQFEVLGVLRQGPEEVVSRLGSSFNVALSEAQYKAIADNNIFYRQDIELAPGTYTLELIVRDKLSGKMTARKEQLVLPVADAAFATSGVVLSHFAERAKPTGAIDVLNQGGVQIRPLPSRRFRNTDNLILFFETYNAATQEATGKPLVRVTVLLMKDGKLARKPIDYVLTDLASEPVPHLTFAKYISLAGLAAGDYTAMIETMDMVTHRLVKQQAAFTITE